MKIIKSTILLLLLNTLAFSEAKTANVKLFFGPHEPGSFFSCSVNVQSSAAGACYECCGFSRGFAGLYEDSDKKRGVILKIWDVDGGRNNPEKVKTQKRAEVVQTHEKAKAVRFGGNGSGAEITIPVAWNVGENFTFAVKSEVIESNKIKFTGWYCDKNVNWIKIGSIKLSASDTPHLKGYYCSVNNPDSTQVPSAKLKAFFTAPWLKQTNGKWMQFITGDFTADPPLPNINAGNTINDQLFLTTGGDTTQNAELLASFSIKESAHPPKHIEEIDKVNNKKTAKIKLLKN